MATLGIEHHADQAARPRRLLVVANETCAEPAVCRAALDHAAGGPAEVRVIAPAHPGRLDAWFVDEGRVLVEANERLATSLRCLERLGLEAEGDVADADPVHAIADALVDFHADEVLVCTHPEPHSAWLRRRVVERARRRFPGLPIAHVVVE
jgi:GABA permease